MKLFIILALAALLHAKEPTQVPPELLSANKDAYAEYVKLMQRPDVVAVLANVQFSWSRIEKYCKEKGMLPPVENGTVCLPKPVEEKK